MDLANNLNKLTIHVPIYSEQKKPPPRFDPVKHVEKEKEKPKTSWKI